MDNERKCEDMTKMMYPDKLTVDEFADEIKESIDRYVKNIKNLPYMPEERWVEEWMDSLAGWMEMY